MSYRKPFLVTDERMDAPDGAVVHLDGGRGWYTRTGMTWQPVSKEEARLLLAGASDMPLPSWERGWRVHGYWLGGVRVGHIGLAPPGYDRAYSWQLDAVPVARGTCSSLAAAKRRVQAAFRAYYSWRFPVGRQSARFPTPQALIDAGWVSPGLQES